MNNPTTHEIHTLQSDSEDDCMNVDEEIAVSNSPSLSHTTPISKTQHSATQQQTSNTPNEKRHLSLESFDCSLCSSLLYEPITTSCGHTFCKRCILRAMDHDNKCPLCRSIILVTPEFGVSVLLQQIIETMFPEEYKQRKQEIEQEIHSQHFHLPLFLLGNHILFPKVTLPLHVFEPRYKLLVRRCLEGSKRFGIVPVINNQLAPIGTVAVIGNQVVFPDGRSIISSVGEARFKVLDVFDQDGYKVAKIEYIVDEPLPVEEKPLKQIARKYEKAQSLVTEKLGPNLKQIEEKFGKMPTSNAVDFCWWLGAVLPLRAELKYQLLEMTSIKKRLDYLIHQMNDQSSSSCIIS